MRLSRASAYALGAVLRLAEAPPGVPIPCSRLAKLGEMPERFLLQVLRNLVTNKILVSTRGVEGGYALARALEEITLLQIFEAIDGPQVPVIPPLDALPQESRFRLQDIMSRITASENTALAAVRLSELYTPKSTDVSTQGQSEPSTPHEDSADEN